MKLLPAHVARISGWYAAFADVAGVATLDEIAANDFNLNIRCYVEPVSTEAVVTVDEAMARPS
ncbi:MAG: N-6 DNA methylase [Vicinamibacterales bacterium]